MSTSDQNAPVIDETVVTTRLQGPVLVVTVDNPPVNALSVHVRAGLVHARKATGFFTKPDLRSCK